MKKTLSISILFLTLLNTAIYGQNAFALKEANPKKALPENFVPVLDEEGLECWNEYIVNNSAKQRAIKPFDVNAITPIQINKALQNSWELKVSEKEMTFFANVPQQNLKLNLNNDRLIEEAAIQFLTDNSAILNLKDAANEFDLREIITDKKGNKHIRLDQNFEGIAIYASDIVVHINEKGVYTFNGRYHKTPVLNNLNPQISESDAQEFIIEDLKTFTTVVDYPNNSMVKHLVAHPTAESELQIYFDKNNQEHLVWLIEFSPNIHEHWQYIIDAHTGEILDKMDNVCHLGPETTTATDLTGTSRALNTWRENNTYYFVDGSRSIFNLAQSTMPDEPKGGIVTLNLNNNNVDQFGNWVNSLSHVQSNSNNFNNPTAVSAHFNGGKCYEYFKNTFNRNGIDGNGGTIWSVINVTDDNGNQFDNAFWNGTAMFYGNGNQVFNQLPKALDVAAHEMSHGVTQNSANLIYQGQSGALNESFSDVFGAMVDRDDWKMGDGITNPNIISSGALRDLQFPNNGQQLNKYTITL